MASWGVRMAALAVAATAASFGFVVQPHPLESPIGLVDRTFAMDPAPDPGDGSLPDGRTLTPFDVQNPAIGRLDPALLTAIQGAATQAAQDGITMTINSGWRSAAFQQQLLDQAVQTYGSVAAARQYVETPALSKHVIGEAVDVGGVGADQWLIANGSRYGLCRIYANELWHFELATDATGNCPPLLPNAAG
jgi:LAS superfamily LD-carboxypeptidase LdcB